MPVTSTSVLLAFLSYNKTAVGSLGNFIFLGSAFVGLFGLWVVRTMFSKVLLVEYTYTDLGSQDSFCGDICNLEENWS